VISPLDESLFCSRALSDVFEQRLADLRNAIVALDDKTVLQSPAEQLCSWLVGKYGFESLILDSDGLTVSQDETDVDVSHRFEYVVIDRDRPTYVRGTELTFHVPVEGDVELFRYRASTFSMNPPRATVRQGELQMSYAVLNDDASAVRKQFDHDFAQLKEHLTWSVRDVQQFNQRVGEQARKLIEQRRVKIAGDKELVTSLGFPVRRREDAPQTYVAPEIRRKVRPSMPNVATGGRLEPALSDDEYEHILSVVSNMVVVMERSPKAFEHMNEEDIRTHFLVQLNGQYEGQATGETFNFEGKTDILIRVEGKNIFVAECKFWHGPKVLQDTITQLLSYATWRDSKLAILLFNRGKSLSNVLEKTAGAVEQHPSFARRLQYDSETGFRFLINHRDDPERLLTLTVLVFDVPGLMNDDEGGG